MSGKAGVLDSYHLGEVLKPSARKLGERCGAAAVDMLARRLTEYIGSAEDDEHSYIWRSAIEDHEQDAHKEDARAVLVDALRDATLGATRTSSPAASAIVKSLLQSPYPTLTRVGIYVCGEHYGTVGEAFWECATGSWFLEVLYWHELYWFINKAFSRFSVAQRAQFLGFVEQLRGDWSDESRQVEWDETHRRDLLHPAFGLGDSEVDEKYQKLVERWGPVRDHPDFHTYSTGGWVGDRSPVASDALLVMSDEELVAFLKGFVPGGRSWDGPTYRGLASSISAAVRASEDGFVGRIGLFADLARPYQHGLLRGLKERWSDDKRDINWPATLSLMQAIVSAPAFRADLAADQAEGWEGFAYQRHLYDWLFKCLVAGGHLRRMVYTEGLPDQVAERALQFLGLAHLEGMESLDGSGLLSELVSELKVKELSQLCWFFWTLRGKAEPSARSSKILVFWMKVAEQVRASRADVPELQSALSQLAVFIHDLTPDAVEALVDAAPHAQVRHHGYMLVQNLARLASQYPKEVATIFRAAMSGFLPDYRKEDVIECVKRLAEAGEVEEAEWICNAYAEQGSTLLKQTYEELRGRHRVPSGTDQTAE